jgi:hypothetical protein
LLAAPQIVGYSQRAIEFAGCAYQRRKRCIALMGVLDEGARREYPVGVQFQTVSPRSCSGMPHLSNIPSKKSPA